MRARGHGHSLTANWTAGARRCGACFVLRTLPAIVAGRGLAEDAWTQRLELPRRVHGCGCSTRLAGGPYDPKDCPVRALLRQTRLLRWPASTARPSLRPTGVGRPAKTISRMTGELGTWWTSSLLRHAATTRPGPRGPGGPSWQNARTTGEWAEFVEERGERAAVCRLRTWISNWYMDGGAGVEPQELVRHDDAPRPAAEVLRHGPSAHSSATMILLPWVIRDRQSTLVITAGSPPAPAGQTCRTMVELAGRLG